MCPKDSKPQEFSDDHIWWTTEDAATSKEHFLKQCFSPPTALKVQKSLCVSRCGEHRWDTDVF